MTKKKAYHTWINARGSLYRITVDEPLGNTRDTIYDSLYTLRLALDMEAL